MPIKPLKPLSSHGEPVSDSLLTGLKQKARKAARFLDQRVAPAAKVVADVGEVVVLFDNVLSPISVTTGLSRGISTFSDLMHRMPTFAHQGERILSISLKPFEERALDALADAKGGGSGSEDDDGRKWWVFRQYGIVASEPESWITYFAMDSIDESPMGAPNPHALEALKRAIFDQIRQQHSNRLELAINEEAPERSVVKPLDFKPLPSPRADEVLGMIQPMIADPDYKAVLLEGRPGTGKTAMAHYLAERLVNDANSEGDGMVLSLRYDLTYMHSDMVREICSIFQPAVVIIDDIDKLESDLPNTVVEELRAGTEVLVIMTANNAFVQGVLDGSLLRNGRIDESFPIGDIGIERRNPTWLEELMNAGVIDEDGRDEILAWPVAFQSALETRYQRRGWNGLNLEEMRQRIAMDVVSNGRLYRASGDEGDDDDEW